jgi:outer membrane receptor protein involved in Fe transport
MTGEQSTRILSWSPQMRGRVGALAVAVLCFALLCSAFGEESTEEETETAHASPQRELLAFRRVETVTLPAKRLGSREGLHSSVTVITGEEVRRWGGVGLSDVFRGVAGIDVMQVTATQTEVTARGFNELLSNRMLVMIDGRSVLQDAYGLALWDNLPIAIEDIDRIEIIRGPGSALYGANAFNGVINIITKPVRSSLGTRLRTLVGNNRFLRSSLIHADTIGCWGYKFVGGWSRERALEDEVTYDLKTASWLVERSLGDVTHISLSTGVLEGDNEYWTPYRLLNYRLVEHVDNQQAYAKADFIAGDLSVQTYANFGYATLNDSVLLTDSYIRTATYDAELEYSRILGPGERLVLGVWCRRNEMSWTFVGPDRVLYRSAAYVQHEWRPTECLELLFGGRADYHELTGDHLTPRISLIFRPWGEHRFRVSAGSAFLSPTYLQSFVDIRKTFTDGLGVTVRGSESLRPETVTSYEVGYRFAGRGLSVQAEAFHYELSDHIQTLITDPLSSPPSPAPDQSIAIGFQNAMNARAYGANISVAFEPASALRFSGSYSYQRLWDNSLDRELLFSPRHKASLGLDAELPWGCLGAVRSHFVSGTEWEDGTLDDSVLLSGYLRQEVKKERLAVEVSLFNLLGTRNREYPGAERLDRQIAVGITLGYW